MPARRERRRRAGDDGWVVNGSKVFITNAGTEITQCVTITALTGDGEISNLVIENGTPGYEISAPIHKMGWKASDTRALSFADCVVPAEQSPRRLAGRGCTSSSRSSTAAGSRSPPWASGSRRAPTTSRTRYARERRQFGRPISSFQAIQFKLADMATEIEGGTRARLEGGLAEGPGPPLRARGRDGEALHG